MSSKPKEKPEVYALHQSSGNWQISRRDFLKAAGFGAATLGVSLSSGCSKSMDKICRDVPSSLGPIIGLFPSADGKILISIDHGVSGTAYPKNAESSFVIRICDFEKHSLRMNVRRESNGYFAAGYYNGTPALFYNVDESRYGADGSRIYFDGLQPRGDQPDHYDIKKLLAEIPDTDVTAFQIDSGENLYILNGNRQVEFCGKNDDYQQKDTLYEASEGMSLKDIRLFNDDKSLFVLSETDEGKAADFFEVMDLQTGEMKLYEGECRTYAFFMARNSALICDRHVYRMISFDDGRTVWTKSYPESEPEKSGDFIEGAAVSPDGSAGFLRISNAFETKVCMFSMTDGSMIKEIKLGSGMSAGPVVSRDGTQFAVSLKNTILFYSLPDLKLIFCPVDMNVLKEGEKGVEVTGVDPVTGEEYQYSMPCGAALPDGAVCTCNCVAGRGGCSCVGYSDSGSGSGGSHYWHPN